jgi:hypothetical protein
MACRFAASLDHKKVPPCLTLIWLAFYDWIGVSKQNDKVYIYTDARRALGMT